MNKLTLKVAMILCLISFSGQGLAWHRTKRGTITGTIITLKRKSRRRLYLAKSKDITKRINLPMSRDTSTAP